MKLSKLFFLSFVLLFLISYFLFLISSELFSQPKEIIELMKERTHPSLPQDLKDPNGEFFEEEFIENNIYKTLQEVNSETVVSVDSIIFISENGGKSKYTYTHESSGKRFSYLLENWNGENWIMDWRYTYTYDSNGNYTLYLYEKWEGTILVNSYRY